MIELKATFGILSSIVVLVGGIPYLKDIHQGKAHPHVLSWLGWTFITALGASAMFAEGSTWVVGILWANALNSFLIAGYSVFKRVGVWSTGIYDYIFFGLGILGLVLWQVLDMPVIALVCAIIADLSFGLPTIIKTWKNPATETPFVWITASISGFLSLLAIQSFAFHEVAYPFYLFVYDTIVLLLVWRVLYKPQKPEERVKARYLELAGLIQNDQMVNKDKESRARAWVAEQEKQEAQRKLSWHQTWWGKAFIALVVTIVGGLIVVWLQ